MSSYKERVILKKEKNVFVIVLFVYFIFDEVLRLSPEYLQLASFLARESNMERDWFGTIACGNVLRTDRRGWWELCMFQLCACNGDLHPDSTIDVEYHDCKGLH